MLVSGNDFYCGNSASNPSQLALRSQIPDVSGFATTSQLNSLKTSVSSGKSIIASAVTDKGVNTAADASFQTIANNINAISSLASTMIADVTEDSKSYENTIDRIDIPVTDASIQSGSFRIDIPSGVNLIKMNSSSVTAYQYYVNSKGSLLSSWNRIDIQITEFYISGNSVIIKYHFDLPTKSSSNYNVVYYEEIKISVYISWYSIFKR
nr:MAG TPA: hypothetical protein [Caudoviricetes sp.]